MKETTKLIKQIKNWQIELKKIADQIAAVDAKSSETQYREAESDKLTIKDIYEYLPFHLNVRYQDFICKIDGITTPNLNVANHPGLIRLMSINEVNEGQIFMISPHKIKPLLIPLDTISNDHLSELILLCRDDDGLAFTTLHKVKQHILLNRMYLYITVRRQLLEWHYDLNNLIGKGLAIQITQK